VTSLESALGLHGRARVSVREEDSGLLVCEQVFDNLETQYALNSVASWLAGGAGVVAPAAPAYLAFGIGPINLLTANQADLESSVAGWQAASNCTVAQSSTVSWDGVYSLAITASSAASMTATTSPGLAGVPVTAGTQYSASAHVRAGATARSAGVNIAWYDASGNLLSTSPGTTTTDSSSAWTRVGVIATAPTNAAFAAVQVAVTSPANGEIHYADGIQFAYAPDGPMPWQAGGQTLTPSVNDSALSQERYLTRAQADTGYTQTSLAVLLHTYQTTDPSGSFSEAGLWDSATKTATLAAQANPGATTLTLAASAPAVSAGTQLFFPAVGEYATVATAAAAGATTWTLTDQLLLTHANGATVSVMSGNLWAHVALTGVSKTGTQLLSLQWEIAVVGS